MQNTPNNYNQHLRKAKRLLKEENSFPSVYRHLVRHIDADMAIAIVNELKEKARQAA